jgi:hypothetical protein
VGVDVAEHAGRPRELASLIEDLRRSPPTGFVRVK